MEEIDTMLYYLKNTYQSKLNDTNFSLVSAAASDGSNVQSIVVAPDAAKHKQDGKSSGKYILIQLLLKK